MKIKKKSRLTVCLVAGVLVLAVSVSAALGSVSGYSRFKEASKALVLDADNYTAQVHFNMQMDGVDVPGENVDLKLQVDGSNYCIHEKNFDQSTRVEYQIGDTVTWFNEDDDYYWSYPSSGSPYFDFGNDEYATRLTNFMEVLADTVVGDLKNNVVLTDSTNGLDTYTVDIARNQVPTLISSGLSLLGCTVQDGNDSAYVEYEDYTHAAAAWYEKQNNVTLTEDFLIGYTGEYDENFDWDSWDKTYSDLSDKVWSASNEMDEHYYGMLDDMDSGVLYVRNDGSYEKYDSYTEFYEANQDTMVFDSSRYIGEDLALDHVWCEFTVDKDNHLIDTSVLVTFTTTDYSGTPHEFGFSATGAFSDYGTTRIAMPDLGGRTLLDPATGTIEAEEAVLAEDIAE